MGLGFMHAYGSLLRLHFCKQQTRCTHAVYQHCLPHMIDVHRVRTSVPKDRCVMATSSTRMLNSLALFVKLSRICGCDNGYHLVANGCELQIVQPIKQCNGLAMYAGYLEHEATNEQWQLTALDTLSRCVNSCSALYCATAAFTISLPMDGSTRSSQSSPRFCNRPKPLQQMTCLAAVRRHSAQQ